MGCARAAPDCGAQETRDLVLKIVTEEIEAAETVLAGLNALLPGLVEVDSPGSAAPLSLSSLRTTSFDREVGKYTCAAELDFVVHGERASVPITYTSELVEDGESKFYATVYGL